MRVSVEGGGDGWSSKELITVTSNHRPDSKCFHLARAKTPGSHLGSTGIRIGSVFNELRENGKKIKKKQCGASPPIVFCREEFKAVLWERMVAFNPLIIIIQQRQQWGGLNKHLAGVVCRRSNVWLLCTQYRHLTLTCKHIGTIAVHSNYMNFKVTECWVQRVHITNIRYNLVIKNPCPDWTLLLKPVSNECRRCTGASPSTLPLRSSWTRQYETSLFSSESLMWS